MSRLAFIIIVQVPRFIIIAGSLVALPKVLNVVLPDINASLPIETFVANFAIITGLRFCMCVQNVSFHCLVMMWILRDLKADGAKFALAPTHCHVPDGRKS